MNISLNSQSMLLQRPGSGLKSTEEKQERQQKAQSQIDFFEAQKANLKNMKCETLEEIGRKLELFNNYNAQIMAVKQQYNQEQMMHTMDEAREFGEKIAEAAEKLEAKTPEERKREQIEEALGIEDEDGLLTEVLEESLDKMILLEEELAEEVSEEDLENMESMENAEMVPGIVQQEELTQEYLETKYTPFDMKA
ncbi:MAG: hypothetical protein K2P35_08575 [Lachnospiraceae bacterium]|nr:hypothetical protein [Lachnospiraceae bacterium]